MKIRNVLKTSLGFIAGVALTFGAPYVKANNTTHSLFGIDVSSFQGYVTWSSVYGNGARFAFAKATEGTATVDSDYHGNISRGKTQGLQMSAYHFSYPAESCPSVQVNHFWASAGGDMIADGKTVYPMVDFEEFSGVACGEGTYTTWYNDYSNDLQAKTSHFLHPVIYVSACNACHLTSAITLSAWIANYNGQSLYTGNPWSTCCSCDVWDSGRCNSDSWTYWQVSSSGSIGGISGNCDFDAYNDTLSLLIANQGIK